MEHVVLNIGGGTTQVASRWRLPRAAIELERVQAELRCLQSCADSALGCCPLDGTFVDGTALGGGTLGGGALGGGTLGSLGMLGSDAHDVGLGGAPLETSGP